MINQIRESPEKLESLNNLDPNLDHYYYLLKLRVYSKINNRIAFTIFNQEDLISKAIIEEIKK